MKGKKTWLTALLAAVLAALGVIQQAALPPSERLLAEPALPGNSSRP